MAYKNQKKQHAHVLELHRQERQRIADSASLLSKSFNAMKETVQPRQAKSHLSFMTRFISKFFILIGIIFLLSCESKSGRLTQIPPEKVVILSEYPQIVSVNNQNVAYYKVYRIKDRVVTYIRESATLRYCKGDTILYKF